MTGNAVVSHSEALLCGDELSVRDLVPADEYRAPGENRVTPGVGQELTVVVGFREVSKQQVLALRVPRGVALQAGRL